MSSFAHNEIFIFVFFLVNSDDDKENLATKTSPLPASRSPTRSVSDTETRFKVFEKVKSLPNVHREVRNTARTYGHVKKSYPFLGFCLHAAEMVFRFYYAVITFICFSPPVKDFTENFLNKCKWPSGFFRPNISFWTPSMLVSNCTLRAESFASRNFRDFRDFDPFSRKLMPGKKLNEKFAKVIFAKNKLFQKSRKFFQSLKNWK